MTKERPRIVANGMLRTVTPVEDYREQYGLWVKREDLACPPPGPPFSKTRGVYEHVRKRPEKLIGVLDTYHSQAGHAVARACQVLGKKCVNYYPEYKNDPGPRPPQLRAAKLGAQLVGLPAGRSCILFHAAKKATHAREGYMMPNALKLAESVEETAKEVPDDRYDFVIIPSSSATIAAGVIKGFMRRGNGYSSEWNRNTTLIPTFIIHLGYSRSHGEVLAYVREAVGIDKRTYDPIINIIDEKYAYKDRARDGETPPWPCNEYYDLKAFRWWLAEGRKDFDGKTLLWNVG